MNDRNYTARPHLSIREINGEIVILDRNTEEIHTLNESASYVWSRLDGSLSRDEIVAGFREDHGISQATAEADVDAIIRQFQALELIE
ncbi:MAG TPA: PqqD family protein [Gammaproteobacteria bacterium]|nr:PqqD family protein [Gammaproteobacteria bacterium]